MAITPITMQYVVDQANNNNFFTINTIQGDGDQARYVELSLTNNGYPYEITQEVRILIKGTKPDGTTIVNECELIEPDVIKFEVTSQMAAVPGMGIYNISIMSTGDGTIVSSFPFYIHVTADTLDPDAPESSDEYQGIVNMLDEIQAQIDQTLEYEVVGTF